MKFYIHVTAKLKWWVRPLIAACRVLAYARLMKEHHVEPLADFIGKRGLKIQTH